MQNATHILEVAAKMAEENNDTDTLLHIAGAWLDIAKNSSKKTSKKEKNNKFPIGFTGIEENGRIIDEDDMED